MYLIRSETHRTDALKIQVCQMVAVRNSIFVGWHNSEMFTVTAKDLYRHYVIVPAFRQIWEAPLLGCFWNSL